MKKLFLHPLFLLGLIVRFGLISMVVPDAVVQWYGPFLQASVGSFSLDPWAVWLQQGGTPAAFPYGYVMWLVFLPLTLICKLTGAPIAYGYGLTLLVADTLLLQLLARIFPGHNKLLLAVYWWSPIVIAASYVFGFNDLVPVALLTFSLYFVRGRRPLRAGMVYVAAVSAKLSMVIALPFFLIYHFRNRALRQHLPMFLRGLILGAAVILLPFAVLTPSGVSMLASNPELGTIYLLAIDFGRGARIYIVPLAYLLVLYLTWRVQRLNFELFNAMMGLAFLLVVLLTPASPGWFIWAMPLLVAWQLRSDRFAVGLVAVFSILYVLSSTPFPVVNYLPPQLEVLLGSVIHTAMVAVGAILAVRIWREAVHRNDFFRLSRRPFVLGIAGDSGAGKDTFSDAMKGLFGAHSVATLSGDDYHLWDRQKPMWQVMTHLNPMANDLEGFANDLVNLRDGKTILSRHYDHSTGRMSRPFRIRSNDIIIASGLHALYLPLLRECYNLSIYLDIDEGLRRHFKLQRDVHQRGHTVERVLSSFQRREPDSVRFIRPQAAHADLVLSLRPIHPRLLEEANDKVPLRFKLITRSRHGLDELSLARVLIGVCGLHVDMATNKDTSEVELTIEGESSAEDIALAARLVCPRIFEFLDLQPKWQDGVMGLMQLIALSHINQALTKRFIW
ncbi:uridine kinase [Burkholderia multivorans]|uniref:uridine kinase n=1 Tax=Burkholderia multivorans TaxID=87883 RepID=UPI000D00D4F7|nr:uridine kinase [Burkholderia multivorans]MBU9212252.1 uridine kinase [Burkholderia multivorans]MCL4628944.1 uridine kinase [Burkholderia multivorans]PRG96083.1 uridine kinase [Burkholderia multivorans]HEF4780134.1 uridine kinase [Burkholderia multivorans]HEF4827430.1 uridine kinase [Burkholderia multivorans]